jgi:hypothetical protein
MLTQLSNLWQGCRTADHQPDLSPANFPDFVERFSGKGSVSGIDVLVKEFDEFGVNRRNGHEQIGAEN